MEMMRLALARALRAADGISRTRTSRRLPTVLPVSGWLHTRMGALRAIAEAPWDPRQIPTRFLADWWPELGLVQAQTRMDITQYWSLPYGERAVLDAIIRYLRPQTAFEFGTFTGSTTALIADAAPPNAVIHTLDRPSEVFDDAYVAQGGIGEDLVGSAFRDRVAENKIVFHRSHSSDFDYASLRGTVDFVFIDGSHAYADVIHDSERALEMLRPTGGVIVWDDYDFVDLGVVQAVHDLSAQIELVHVASTRLVVHRRGAPQPPGETPREGPRASNGSSGA